MTWTIHQGDVLDVLRTMPAESVHCVVTSPPYWGLRQYLFDKAVVVRYDLDDDTKQFVLMELKRRGIKPRQTGKVQERHTLAEAPEVPRQEIP